MRERSKIAEIGLYVIYKWPNIKYMLLNISQYYYTNITLQVYPPSGGPKNKTAQSSETLYTMIQQLKKVLPNIVVKGIPTVSRAIIHKEATDDTYKLLVESRSLREVMCTRGVDWKHTTSNHILEVISPMC